MVNEQGSLVFLVPTVSNTHLEFATKGSLVPSRWHMISFSLNNLNLQVSLNGLPDSTFKFPSESLVTLVNPTPTESTSPQSASSKILETPDHLSKLITKQIEKTESHSYIQLVLGRSLIYPSASCLVDQVKMFNRFYGHDKLRQMAISEGVPFADEEIEIGCLNCTFSEASKACSKNFHLCTQQEIYAFAFQVARINGWTKENKRIWSFSPITDDLIHSKVQKLGLCCRSSHFVS